LAVATFLTAVVVAWAAIAQQRQVAECVLPKEAPRALDLANPDDARHLAADLAQAEAIAQRYREAIRQEPPPASDSVDARRNHALRPDRAYAYCTAILKEQLARTHSIPVK
jgi:hypothetical protein